MKPLLDRIKDRCRLEPATGCWVWDQGTNNAGYPQMSISAISPQSFNVRRLVYVIAVGPIGKTRVITSTCSDPLCLNPAHLLQVKRETVATRTINMVNRVLTTEARRAAKARPAGTWHPPAPPPSKLNGRAPGGTSKKPRKTVSPATSISAAGLSSGSGSTTARTWPSVSGASYGPTSGQGQGE